MAIPSHSSNATIASAAARADSRGCQEIASRRASAFAFELLSKLTLPSRIRYRVEFEGTIDEKDRTYIERLLNQLQDLSKDRSLKIVEIRRGSIILILEGMSDGFEELESHFKAGRLTHVGGLRVRASAGSNTRSTDNPLGVAGAWLTVPV